MTYREDKKKEILESAKYVFEQNGYARTTTSNIAIAANISEVTLFRYFRSKQEMFLEIVKPVLQSSLEGAININKNLSEKEQLLMFLKERIKSISENRDTVRLIISESTFIDEIGEPNFIDNMIKLVGNYLVNLKIKNQDFVLRLIIGSMLSFLFIEEHDENKIIDYINTIIKQNI